MNIEPSELSKQLHCYRNIHMYDDAGHHHGSQCKQITAFKRQAPSQTGHFFYFLFHLLADIEFDKVLWH